MKSEDERNRAVARAIQEATNTCGHPPEVISTDLATGDLFCGDCGAVTNTYTGQQGRLSGDEAATAIAGSLEGIGSVTVYSVWHAGGDTFEVGTRVITPGANDWHYFVVTRTGSKLIVTEKK